MALPGSYVDLNIRQYSDLIEHELQQNGSLLRGTVTVEQAMGERSYFNKIGKANSKVRTNRIEKVEPEDQTYERRLVTPTAIVSHEFIDQLDLDRYLRSPQPELAQAMAMELGRRMDSVIISAIGGTAGREVNGVSSNVAFDSNQVIAVNNNALAGSTMSGNTSLHEGKIMTARSMLESKYGIKAGEEVFVLGNAKQFAGLASRVLSNNGAGFFQKGMPQLNLPMLNMVLDGFMGFRFITYEDIGQISSNDAVYVVPKSAVKMGIWRDLQLRADPRVDLEDQPTQLSASMAIGAVRMFEEKVVRILCNPTITYA